MLVTLFGMLMEVRLEQSEKAKFSMLVTQSGISMEVKLPHPLNASLPIVFTPSGIVALVIFLSLTPLRTVPDSSSIKISSFMVDSYGFYKGNENPDSSAPIFFYFYISKLFLKASLYIMLGHPFRVRGCVGVVSPRVLASLGPPVTNRGTLSACGVCIYLYDVYLQGAVVTLKG